MENKITEFLFGGKNQGFFVENAKIINIKNMKSLQNVSFTLMILQLFLCLAGLLFDIRRDLATIYAIFWVLFTIMWILIRKSIKEKQYQRASAFLPIVVFMAYGVAIPIGTVLDPNGKPIMTIAVSILLPILFIMPLSKTISYLAIALSAFITFDVVARGDLKNNLFQLVLYSFFGILAGHVRLKDSISGIEDHNELSYDQLTKLRNSRFLNDVSEMIKWNNYVCVGIIDIDYFKAYNDIKGHDSGDEVLRRVADTMNRIFSENGILLIRRSEAGDEFVFIATGKSAEEIVEKKFSTGTTIAQDLLRAIRKLEIVLPYKEAYEKSPDDFKARYGNIPIDENPFLSISGGYWLYTAKNGGKKLSDSQSKREIDIMLKKADLALCTAKKNGRNRFCGNKDIEKLPEFKKLEEFSIENMR